MKSIIVVIFTLFSFSADACVAPRGGEKFDSLITLERIKKNQYRVTVPEILEDLTSAEIILAYDKTHAGGIPIYDPYEVLKPVVTNGVSTVTFFIEKKGEEKPYISVMWWPEKCCPCGIQANTGFIEPE
ncbi:hypothetical protein [Motilimonas eburnea]|uniref:hypothetical protein n=1 Tax=Motilimonas eburnea TaxID=1737488 RepID=UPI001E51057C|nr:hypothetical protein [Motilimonas eburnea]MCE2570373.1 hypothetical protein [Motilimonas eburnea]